MPPTPSLKEDHISQIPALQLLQNLGWVYLPPAEAMALRGGRVSAVILDGIIDGQLRKMNRISYKGAEYPFSEGNIHAAMQALKDVPFDGPVRTNEKMYDLLSLGKSMQQSVEGDLKSFTLHYVDWEHPERNVYHVTEEFAVERTGSKDTYRPDIVLFVNGIPLGVIECKRPDLGPGHDPLEQAVSQHLRNQKTGGITRLFDYVQLLLAVCMNDAKYGTAGTEMKFWARWREREEDENALRELVNRPLSDERKALLFEYRKAEREYFDAVETEGGREITAQDRAIAALCKPERLLELAYRYLLFDGGTKKIARYQQYFCVKKIMERIHHTEEGRRKGGVVWHTQGSGKSLTMVMLAKAIALDDDIHDHKIVLVTDRVDLDDQIYKTFGSCGMELTQATTGANLVEMLSQKKQRIITTVINKFEAAVGKQGVVVDDPNIFVLVDEGHRTQYGTMHAKMRKALPRACFIAFTGTPVITKEKSTVEKFGGFIRPAYTIKDAVEDEAVVPLLYEGRHVREKVDPQTIDEWFERLTQNLSDEEKADLKRKFSTPNMLMRAEPVVREIAWDISTHYRDNWQVRNHGGNSRTWYKAQLVAPRQETALLYKKFLDEFGMVKSEVLISAPDEREGEEDVFNENREPVIRFWNATMERYGTEKEYNRQVIGKFKDGDPTDADSDALEIIIVVDKLTTGFDAPCNTVLYLARELQEHTLLQAIARVNRLHPGKDYGYIIDYRGVLENLDHALDIYGNMANFDRGDLEGTLTDVRSVIAQLPQRHSMLWDTFKSVGNTRDQEAYERLLADDALRVRFYERFTAFARTLGVALSTETFLNETPDKRIAEYKRDLKFFRDLRQSVRRRYAETVDFSEYEPKIRKLLDTHLGTEGVERITGAFDLLNKEHRSAALEEAGSVAAKADTIAHNTKRVLEVKWKKEDPAFYKKFSRMLQDAIDDFRAGRIGEAQYFEKSVTYEDSVLNRTGDNLPEVLYNHDYAKAYFGCVRETLATYGSETPDIDSFGAEVSLAIEKIIEKRRVVNLKDNPDAQNRIKQDVEDYLFEVKESEGLDLTFEDIDRIMDDCLGIAIERQKS